MRTEQLRGHLEMLLLGTLESAPAHGYAVITSLRDKSNGLLDLNEGAVYPALHRLEDEGLLTSDWEKIDGRRRRVYTVTTKGLTALADQHHGWKQLSQAVDSVLSLSPSLKLRFA